MDAIDSKLLDALQIDAHLTSQELSDKLNLSPSQVGRRRQRLENDGLIDRSLRRRPPFSTPAHREKLW